MTYMVEGQGGWLSEQGPETSGPQPAAYFRK